MSRTGDSSTGGATGGRKAIPEFAAALIGRTLDSRFRIDTAIGQGAMGTVFAATQLSVNRRVAVKVLREQISETSKKRFMREARAISSLNHPNIVQLIDFGERDDGLLYLVMEYVEGLRMSRLNKKGRLHPNLIIELIAQLCSALAEAHSHGIVHRDLKPSNILLVITADGSLQVKVLDFGVAHTYEDAAELTATGVLCGTPAYMAPEQARGKHISPSVDLYALGVNMYQMLGGFRPFRGATPVEVAMKQIQAAPPSLQQYIDKNLLPSELTELAEALMSKEPEQRPQTASEVRQRVLQIRREFDWGPLVFDASSSDAWSRWTQQRLAEHGGRPLREAIKQSTSWSGSWSDRARSNTGARPRVSPDSQAALHDASRVPAPPTTGSDGDDRGTSNGSQPSSSSEPSRSSPPSVPSSEPSKPSRPSSVDSLPSRHGGGWDAFRDQKSGFGGPLNEGSAGAHVMEPEPSHLPPPDAVATPSEETAHIYNTAHQSDTVDTPPPRTPDPDRDVDVPGEYVVPDAVRERSVLESQPSPADEDEIETVIESTAESYQGMMQPDTSRANTGGIPAYENLSTLVADRPGPRSGTLVDDVEEDSGASTTDIVRFVLVALFAFGVFMVVGWFVLRGSFGDSTETETTDPPAVEEQEVTGSVADEQSDERPQREPAAARPARKKTKGAKSVEDEPAPKQKESEPIDLFGEGEVDDRSDGNKIIIEEKR